MASTTYDESRAEAFAGRMLDLLNGGALAVMISVGHRTGLFDALAGHDDVTSQELADAAGLDERYVREWLGAMTAGRIVELDPATARYALPRRARSLADARGVARQPRGRGAVDHEPLDRRGRHRRVLPRRAAACRTSATRASTR